MNLIDELAEPFELLDKNGNAIKEFYAALTLDSSGIICGQCFDFNYNTIRRNCNGEMYSINASDRELLVHFPGYFYPFTTSNEGKETNGDLIRAMSDEDLSKFLVHFTEWLVAPVCKHIKIEKSNPEYKKQLLKWLESKA